MSIYAWIAHGQAALMIGQKFPDPNTPHQPPSPGAISFQATFSAILSAAL